MDIAAEAEFSEYMDGRWGRLVRLGYGPNPKVAYCLAGAAPQVSRVELRLSDGSVHELQPVAVGHAKYFAFALSRVSLTEWTAFDTAGHQLGTGTGKSL